MNIIEGNIPNLYDFLMNFNVFTYVVNPIKCLENCPAGSIPERARTPAYFGPHALNPRLASFLRSSGVGDPFKPL